MAQRVTLLGEVINATKTPLDMAQRVTLLGVVINTTNTPLHMAQRVTLLRRSHKYNKYTFTYDPAGNFIWRSHKHKK